MLATHQYAVLNAGSCWSGRQSGGRSAGRRRAARRSASARVASVTSCERTPCRTPRTRAVLHLELTKNLYHDCVLEVMQRLYISF